MLRSNWEQAGHFRKKLKRNRCDMNSLTSIIITIMIMMIIIGMLGIPLFFTQTWTNLLWLVHFL